MKASAEKKKEQGLLERKEEISIRKAEALLQKLRKATAGRKPSEQGGRL